jgi:hypothetical protein
MSVSLKFHDSTDDTVLTMDIELNEIHIHLESKYEEECWGIFLDKSTAIKFSKELRKQIALLD